MSSGDRSGEAAELYWSRLQHIAPRIAYESQHHAIESLCGAFTRENQKSIERTPFVLQAMQGRSRQRYLDGLQQLADQVTALRVKGLVPLHGYVSALTIDTWRDSISEGRGGNSANNGVSTEVGDPMEPNVRMLISNAVSPWSVLPIGIPIDKLIVQYSSTSVLLVFMIDCI
jgi:hypothetical protein